MLGLDLAGSLERDERGLLYRSFKERRQRDSRTADSRGRNYASRRKESLLLDQQAAFTRHTGDRAGLEDERRTLGLCEHYELLGGGGRISHNQASFRPRGFASRRGDDETPRSSGGCSNRGM